MFSLPWRNKCLTLALNKRKKKQTQKQKTNIKVFLFYVTLLDFLLFVKIFCTGLSVETNAYNSPHSPSIFNILIFCCNLEIFLKPSQQN